MVHAFTKDQPESPADTGMKGAMTIWSKFTRAGYSAPLGATGRFRRWAKDGTFTRMLQLGSEVVQHRTVPTPNPGEPTWSEH
ncbi:hypothetical protein TUSST3_15120 [Streptomyces sp. TUS-ST3]|nr:hypothetical protein TUSST3_15120 [Streptomyces sp. TUS-ST3]